MKQSAVKLPWLMLSVHTVTGVLASSHGSSEQQGSRVHGDTHAVTM